MGKHFLPYGVFDCLQRMVGSPRDPLFIQRRCDLWLALVPRTTRITATATGKRHGRVLVVSGEDNYTVLLWKTEIAIAASTILQGQVMRCSAR